MPVVWKIQYPQVFIDFNPITTELEEELYMLLDWINRAGDEFIHEETLRQILSNALSRPDYLSDLKESFEKLILETPLSQKLCALLISMPYPQMGVEFLTHAHQHQLDISKAIEFLSHHVNLNGLSRAMLIFEQSDWTYHEDHLEKLKILSFVLANPLCQTIFDARLRNFTYFHSPSDPLKTIKTNQLIAQLIEASTADQQIEIFFDYFTQFRPYPPSQRFMVDIDVSDKVDRALQATDLETSTQDAQTLFDLIKYEVASEIETEDLYSTRSYQVLMNEIMHAIPQHSSLSSSEPWTTHRFGR